MREYIYIYHSVDNTSGNTPSSRFNNEQIAVLNCIVLGRTGFRREKISVCNSTRGKRRLWTVLDEKIPVCGHFLMYPMGHKPAFPPWRWLLFKTFFLLLAGSDTESGSSTLRDPGVFRGVKHFGGVQQCSSQALTECSTFSIVSNAFCHVRVTYFMTSKTPWRHNIVHSPLTSQHRSFRLISSHQGSLEQATKFPVASVET